MSALPHVFPTVVHMLLEAAGRAPEREALVCGEERLTYREYLRCVCGFARELKDAGAAGGRVALIMGNSADICIATFAAHFARAQVVPLNPLYTTRELGPMLQEAEPCCIVYDEEVASAVEPIAAQAGIGHRVRVGPGAERLVRWRDDATVAAPVDLPGPGDPGTLQFTGGTTGQARGADLSHAALSVNLSQREALAPNRPDVERMLCVMPLFHCYASHMCLHAMAYSRGTLVILPKYRPGAVLDLLENERITLFGGSPTLFSGLLRFEGFAGRDFRHLHRTYSGSAPLPEELIRQWEAITGSTIIEGYGQSESGPVISFNPAAGVRKPGSVGLPVPGTELEIVDVETGTRILAQGEKGEVRIRGPQLMSAYRKRPADSAAVLRNGWLHTGDVGELDVDGYLYIRGRRKEMIIVSGYNVFPREVEEVLHTHPGVHEAAVVGRPDGYRGELPVAYVVYRPEVNAGPAELESWCLERMAKYKVPAEFRQVSALPRTAIGKIDKVELARRAREKLHTEP